MPSAQNAEREFRRRFWWAISVPLLLMGLLVALFIFQTSRLNVSIQEISRSNATLVQVERLRRSLAAMESNAEEYQITRNPDRLVDWNGERAEIPTIFRDLENSRGNADGAISPVKARFESWARSLGSSPIRFRQGWDALIHSIDQVLQIEIAKRAQSAASARSVFRHGNALGIGIAIVLGVLLTLFTRRQLTEISRRYRLALEASREKTEAVEEALRTRDDFFSIASHELKTPITTMELRAHALERLLQEAPLAPSSRTPIESALRSLRRQIQRLSELVENILDAARIRTGHLIVDRNIVEVSVPELIARSVRESKDLLDQFHCRVALRCDPAMAKDWDGDRIVQALKALITNSAKYAPNSTIQIYGNVSGSNIRIQVIDQGPGIPLKDHPRIFRLFERAVSSRSYGGLGTGLYISREIIEAHGGSIRIDSKPAENGTKTGATIVIDLPLSSAWRQAAA